MEKKDRNNLIAIAIFLGIIVIIGIFNAEPWRNASASFNVGNIYVVLGEDSACLHTIARFYPDFYAIWEVNHQQVINERYGKKEDKKTNNTSTSTSTKPTYSTKKPHDTYDDGYEDVWLDGEPDWDRYENDWDYALGADDAMDEFDW